MATTLQVEAVLAPTQLDLTAKWTPAVKALLLTIGLRIFYSLFAAIAAPGLSLNPKLIESNSLTGDLISRSSHPLLYALLGVWQRFDTLWYIQIARHGYNTAQATVFYPLYPILIRTVSYLTHSELAAALLISTVASFFLFWGAQRLFELDAAPPVAFCALLLWIAWPASFTFFAGYPDSLLCALTIWAICFARQRRWAIAGIFGLLAGSTKAMGCLTFLPLLWIAWKQRNRGGIPAAALSMAGTGFFQLWLAIEHFPSAVHVYRTYWATTTVAPWTSAMEAVMSLIHAANPLLMLNVGVFVLVGAAALTGPVRFEYKLFAIAALCLFLTKHTEPLLQSTTRYSLAVFAAYPAFAARLGQGLPYALIVFIATALNLLLFRTFLDWGLVV